MVSLMSEERHHSSELVGPTDLNQTATELADWLLLIHQMLKSNIVTVGDKDEIHTTISRLQVRKRAECRKRMCLCHWVVNDTLLPKNWESDRKALSSYIQDWGLLERFRTK